MYIYIYIYMNIYVYICICICISIYMLHTHTHTTNTHTHTQHTYTHTHEEGEGAYAWSGLVEGRGRSMVITLRSDDSPDKGSLADNLSNASDNPSNARGRSLCLTACLRGKPSPASTPPASPRP